MHPAADHLASFGRQILAMLGSIGLTVLLQWTLFRRMDPERRARGWSGVSWAAAVYAFGPLSMLGFCWTTRRQRGLRMALRALVAGVFWIVFLGIALFAIDFAYATVFSLDA